MGELPNKMHGVWLTGHGGLDRLEVRNDIPVPRPGPRDVLIRVGAAAVNNTDINTRTAWYSKNGSASRDGRGGRAKLSVCYLIKRVPKMAVFWS